MQQALSVSEPREAVQVQEKLRKPNTHTKPGTLEAQAEERRAPQGTARLRALSTHMPRKSR